MLLVAKASAGLIRDTQYFEDTKGINVLTQTEALAIERQQKKVRVRNLDGSIIFVDVRETDETKANPVKGVHIIVIPLGELRKRYAEIPQDRPVVTFCELGIRGYDAACFLKGIGFQDVSFLEGGMSTWGALRPALDIALLNNTQ